MYITKIILQCNFSLLNYGSNFNLVLNLGGGLELAALSTDLWISPDKLLQVPRILPNVL